MKKRILFMITLLALLLLWLSCPAHETDSEEEEDKENQNIAVTGITLNENVIELEGGEMVQFIATVLPADATNKNVTWSVESDVPEVISLSANGLARALAIGTATVKVITADGDFTAECNVTVLSNIVYKAPVADAGVSIVDVMAGELIFLDASSSYDEDGSIDLYVWEFSDGVIQEGMTASHTIDLKGSYSVVLTVTDNDDLTADDTVKIYVGPFAVKLVDHGSLKVTVVQYLQDLLGLGLNDTIELVNSAPVIIKNDCTHQEASEIKNGLEERSALAEIIIE